MTLYSNYKNRSIEKKKSFSKKYFDFENWLLKEMYINNDN